MALRLIALLAVFVVAACGTTTPSASSGGHKVQVVAAENFWGSIAAQVGGDHANVTSIIANPDTDPHDYEATPSDARLVATADYVIANGVGYDPWVQKLVDANPVAGRKLLVVGDKMSKKDGDNPHLWYSPDYVRRFVDIIGADLGALDPADADYFTQQALYFKGVSLMVYNNKIGIIRDHFVGTKVGASESIFSYLADALNLDLVTPYSYLKAVSEGAEPSAADRAEVEREIMSREIRVFVFNSQNSTPDVQGLVAKARAAGIPVVAITETLTPKGATFQQWQGRQLNDLLQALG